MEIPDSFLAKVARQFGEPGEAWGRELPRIVDHCRRAWQLGECIPVPDLSINLVCPCTSATHGEVVLKLNGPAFMEAGRFIQNHSVFEPGPLNVEDLLRTVHYSRALCYPHGTILKAFLILHVPSYCWDWEMRGDPADLERGQARCARLLEIAEAGLD